MKNNIILKYIITVSFSLIIISCGNKNDLKVDKKAQEKSSWCWAACIQMLSEYHPIKPLRQCEIYKLKSDIDGACSGICNVENIPHDSTNQTCDPADIPSLLDNLNLSCSCIDGLLDWCQIKKQLDTGLPLILLLQSDAQKSSDPNLWNNHYIVVKGYLETSSLHLLHINDPWSVCQGCTYYISYDFLKHFGLIRMKTLNPTEIGDLGPTFFDIHKKSLSMGEQIRYWYGTLIADIKNNSCIEPTPIINNKFNPEKKAHEFLSEIAKIQDNNFGKTIGFKQNDKIKNQKIFKNIPLKSLSVDKILKNDVKLDLNVFLSSIHKQQIVLQNDDGSYTIITLWHDDSSPDFWIVESIDECSWLPLSQSVYCQLFKKNISANDYEIIEFPPFQYKFYHFVYENKSFFVPYSDYFIDINNFGNQNPYFKKNTAYNQDYVIKTLKLKSQQLSAQKNIISLKKL